jgi:hypothetical protein
MKSPVTSRPRLESDLLTVGAAAHMLHVTRWGVHWYVASGQLAPRYAETTQGQQLLLVRAEVRRLLNARADRRERRPPAVRGQQYQLPLRVAVATPTPQPWVLPWRPRAKAKLHDRGANLRGKAKVSGHVA